MKELETIKQELGKAKVHDNPFLKEVVSVYKILEMSFENAYDKPSSIKEIYITVDLNDDLNPFSNSHNQLEIVCDVNGEEKRFARVLNSRTPYSPFDVILTSYYLAPEVYQNTLILAKNHGYREVNLTDILFIKSNNNVTFFFLETSEVLFSDASIGEYTAILEEYDGFERVHESYIVNRKKVIGIDNNKLQIIVPEKMNLEKAFEVINTFFSKRLLTKPIVFKDDQLERKHFRIPVSKDSLKDIDKRILQSRRTR